MNELYFEVLWFEKYNALVFFIKGTYRCCKAGYSGLLSKTVYTKVHQLSIYSSLLNKLC